MALTYILFLFLIIFLFAKFIQNKKIFPDESDIYYPKSYDFKLKRTIMSASEQALYINLQKVLNEKYIILCKVRIEDFVDVIRENHKSKQKIFGLRNRIKSRHVDFLICDFQTTEPLLAIELDGNSHYNSRQKERDRFIDNLYQSIGLPIEHIRVGSDFYELAKEIDIKISKQKISAVI